MGSKTKALFAGLALAAGLSATALARPDEKGSRLVVHEWGTLTSVAGSDGAALEWRPLAGPSDLPRFVYGTSGARDAGLRHGELCKGCGHAWCCCGEGCNPRANGPCRCKGCMTVSVRMETPVLYFYSDRETKVAVKVGFPRGKVTEWYPQARQVGDGIDWGAVLVRPGATPELPREAEPSHYYPAREVDAAPVRVCGGAGEQHERFLFYRGAGTFDLPLVVKLGARDVSVANAGRDAIEGALVLFEKRDGKVGWRKACGLAAGAEVSLARPELRATELAPLLRELEGLLVSRGLYPREAAAMLKTWEDSWFEDGVRVLYALPRRRTDEVLPLALDPAPRELVRVLVGRVEAITPELERAIEGALARLGSESVGARDAASKELARLGRFAEPALRRVVATTSDPEIRARARALLARG